MFLKWLIELIALILGISIQTESTCNVEPGIYISNPDGLKLVDTDLLFNYQMYSKYQRLDLKGRLILTVDAEKQMSLAGFLQKETVSFYYVPILGRFVAPPEIGRVEFSQLQSVCKGNLVVLSWLGNESSDQYSYSGLLKGYFENKTNSIFSTLPSLSNFSIRFGWGDEKKQLLLKKLDIPYEADLTEADECLIPGGVYKGMQFSDLIEVEIDNNKINLTLQSQGVIYNGSPIAPDPVLYNCQGYRLIVIYINSEGRDTVFAGEWNENENSIGSIQHIETLVEGNSLNVNLTPVQ